MQGLVFVARTSPPYFVTYYLGPSHAPPVPCGTGVRDVRAWTSKRTFTPDPVLTDRSPHGPGVLEKPWPNQQPSSAVLKAGSRGGDKSE